jgi:hypothetical protein
VPGAGVALGWLGQALRRRCGSVRRISTRRAGRRREAGTGGVATDARPQVGWEQRVQRRASAHTPAGGSCAGCVRLRQFPRAVQSGACTSALDQADDYITALPGSRRSRSDVLTLVERRVIVPACDSPKGIDIRVIPRAGREGAPAADFQAIARRPWRFQVTFFSQHTTQPERRGPHPQVGTRILTPARSAPRRGADSRVSHLLIVNVGLALPRSSDS